MRRKFEVGQKVWFLPSVRWVEVVEDHGNGIYTVEVMDSGRRFDAAAEELDTLDKKEDAEES